MAWWSHGQVMSWRLLVFSALLTSVTVACGPMAEPRPNGRPDPPGARGGDGADPEALRAMMVSSQIRARGIDNGAVLDAMRRVPRHRFVPPALASQAYDDTPLPIGHDQTISQPYIVAYMTDLLRVTRHHKVLEIGTGSGYQAAILGELAQEVYTIEIVGALAESARGVLQELGYENVHVRYGDGYQGWPEHAPFDRILLTAAPREVPQPLIDQLADGGRLVAPVGGWAQEIVILTKRDGRMSEERTIPVRFVPLTRTPRE
jgi:protein-L-isoaspartate(D-aspartate) O-methyltransferase